MSLETQARDRAARFALLVLAGLGLLAPAPAPAAGGSYATAGTGTYAQTLWWLDFTGYNNATAAGGGQAYNFTLPGGIGSLTTTLTLAGNGTLAAVATPAWSGGGAIGHGAYNGIAGAPALYWLNQPGGTGTVSLTALVAKDAGGNVRNFALFAADAENTNNGETIVYSSTAPWKLIDTVNYYASYNGSGPVLAGAGTASVTESAPTSNDGSYNASIILGTQTPTQASAALSNNEAVMFGVAFPTVALTVNVAGRIVSSDEFTANLDYTAPAYALKAVSTSGTATTAATGATPVIGNNGLTLSVSMAPGSPSPIAYYTGSVACTNSGPGASGYGGTNTTLPTGAGTSFTVTPQVGDAIACTLTVTPAQQTLSGTVYGDSNHDAALDNGESGTGLSGLYVKLTPSSGGSCQGPATAAAAVNAATGAYGVVGVEPGTYCLILTNSSSLANVTAYVPVGYIATEAASGIRPVTVSASPTPVQNFGLFGGSSLTVTVFSDTGSGSGTANDGVQNGSEAGIANVVVTASVGASALASATTNAAGAAVLWLPSAAVGSAVTVTAALPAGDVSTGGTAGTTGGSYARPAVSFTLGAGQAYSGVSFGMIPSSSFTPNGAQTVLAGATVFYAHAFIAGSAGLVTFSTSARANPTLSGWSEVIYRDTACSGQYAGADPALSAAVAVSAGQTVCILVREFAPATAPAGATDQLTVSAALVYSGSAAPAPITLIATDLTTVSGTGALLLTKRVQNVSTAGAYATTDNALPGQTLQYQLTVINQGASVLSALTIDDATPAYTTFLAAACPAPASLPANLTACSVSVQPAAGGTGALQWSFAGTLAPGAQTQVTFEVMVAP